MNNRQHEYHEQVNIYNKYLWYQERKMKKNIKLYINYRTLVYRGPLHPQSIRTNHEIERKISVFSHIAK